MVSSKMLPRPMHFSLRLKLNSLMWNFIQCPLPFHHVINAHVSQMLYLIYPPPPQFSFSLQFRHLLSSRGTSLEEMHSHIAVRQVNTKCQVFTSSDESDYGCLGMSSSLWNAIPVHPVRIESRAGLDQAVVKIATHNRTFPILLE